MLRFADVVDPRFGEEVTTIGDFVISPLFTEDGCKKLLELSDVYSDKYSNDGYTNDLMLWKVSYYFFEEYAKFVGDKVAPLLKSVFPSVPFIGIDSPYLVKHEVGQSTDLHNDLSMISLSVKLNDSYEGGELVFPRQGFSNRTIPIGHGLFFPSTVTHPHCVTEVINGTKHTFVGFTHPITDEPKANGYSSFLFQSSDISA